MEDEWKPAYYDEQGERYELDQNGNRMPPMQISPIKDDSGFTSYDSSNGHCGLCGSLLCRGSCFK